MTRVALCLCEAPHTPIAAWTGRQWRAMEWRGATDLSGVSMSESCRRGAAEASNRCSSRKGTPASFRKPKTFSP